MDKPPPVVPLNRTQTLTLLALTDHPRTIKTIRNVVHVNQRDDANEMPAGRPYVSVSAIRDALAVLVAASLAERTGMPSGWGRPGYRWKVTAAGIERRAAL
jgi:predicted ArsR family transcriptional regulator